MTETPAPGWYDNPDGKRQWWDGSAWGPIAEGEDAKPEGTPQAPAPNTKGCGIGCLSVIGVVILIGAVVGITSNTPEAKAERDRENASVYAEIACKDNVESRLKSPSTAKFSNVVANGYGTSFTVTGSVDAQNGFGAEIRSLFSCDVKIEGDQTVTSNVVIE